MSEAGRGVRGKRAAGLTLVIALALAGLALFRLDDRAPGDLGAVGRGPGEGRAGFPTCVDPVAVGWPGAGERLGCLAELPALMQVAAEAAGCRLSGRGEAGSAKDGPETRLKAGDRLRFTVGEGGSCALSIEALPGTTLVALGLPIDLNRARAEDLEALGAIGSTRARAVIADREARGPFESVEALTRVSGIGPKTLALIRTQVTVAKTSRESEDAP